MRTNAGRQAGRASGPLHRLARRVLAPFLQPRATRRAERAPAPDSRYLFEKLHLLSQDAPEPSTAMRSRKHPYLCLQDGTVKGPAVFDWSERQRSDLEALWRDPGDDGARERLAADLAAFVSKLGWSPDARTLKDAEAHGEEYTLTISADPPELYVLPWEVTHVGAERTYLSSYATAQVRYAVPGLEPRPIQPAPPSPGVLFAWSDAGGPVPHDDQAAAIQTATEAGGVAFQELAAIDEASLQRALDAGPPSVLHLLAHGLPGAEGQPPRLAWGAVDSRTEITATRLAQMLRPHSDAIRLVVLSACGSGDGHGDPLFMTSFAQELHRKGIPGVVASRYPLSVPGSRVLTRALYDKMLREGCSMERALLHARAELLRVDEAGESHAGDAHGLQLYAHDRERFCSDNGIEAERPVLASYPFGTPAQPTSTIRPPGDELLLDLEADAELAEEPLADKLRRVSEDDGLTVSVRDRQPGGRVSLLVRTTVDGAQRLLGAKRSKILPIALGVMLAKMFMARSASAAGLKPPPWPNPHPSPVAAAKLAGAAAGCATLIAGVIYAAHALGGGPDDARTDAAVPVAAMPVAATPDAAIDAAIDAATPDAAIDAAIDAATPDAAPTDAGPTPVIDAPPEPVCGNHKRERGEDCDDGNHRDGDGCSSSCRREPPPQIEKKYVDLDRKPGPDLKISAATRRHLLLRGVHTVTVRLSVCIDSQGHVTKVDVPPLPEPELEADKAAMVNTASSWLFEPYTQARGHVLPCTHLTTTFKLDPPP